MSPPGRPDKRGKTDGCYPPSRFAVNASSPYFIGKHKMSRKRLEKGEKSLTQYGFGGDGFRAGTQVEVHFFFILPSLEVISFFSRSKPLHFRVAKLSRHEMCPQLNDRRHRVPAPACRSTSAAIRSFVVYEKSSFL